MDSATDLLARTAMRPLRSIASPPMAANLEFQPSIDEGWRHLHVELRALMARAGIQAALLLNGGAAVAMLAFLERLAAPDEGPLSANPALIKWALLSFAFGVFLAPATFIVAFLGHATLAEDPQNRAVYARYKWTGMAMIIGSLGCFALGIGVTASAVLVK